MPVYQVFGFHSGYDKYRDPMDVEQMDLIQKLESEMHEKSWKRVLKTIDEEIEDAVNKSSAGFTWTKTGALLGHSAPGSHSRINHVWEKLIDILGATRFSLMGAGALVLWRISLRDETWLMYKQIFDTYDPETGEQITVAHYWTDDKFVPKTKPSKKILASDEEKAALAAMFNKR